MGQTGHYGLPAGTRIGPYEIVEELGSGGFGITYKAYDHRLQTHVAIKEYLPVEFAVREADSISVSPRNDSVSKEYRFGLQGFLAEARTLAQFRDARIVRVNQFLEANGTAYLVMDYEEGEALSELLKKNPSELSETDVLRVMVPILEGLAVVHEAGILHRDVKPANIYLRSDGPPVLLDFGAARHALGEESKNLTSIVTPGYGPFEQYQSTGKQGPWTDLYGAGATLYRMLTGRRPADAPDRVGAVSAGDPDPNPPTASAARGEYSRRLLDAVDWMIRPFPQDRPQSVAAVLDRFRDDDDDRTRASAPSLAAAAPLRAFAARSTPRSGGGFAARSAPPSGGGFASAPVAHPDAKRQWVLGLAIALGVSLVVAGLGFLATGRREAPPLPVAQEPVAQEPVVDEAAIRAEAERQAEIRSLLAAGAAAIEEARLTTPEDDSAMYYYQRVLSLDPENEEAEQGIRNIVTKYVEMAENAAASGNVDRANSFIDRAGTVSPNDPELIAARARLASAPRAAPSPPKRASPRYTSFRIAEADYRKGKLSAAEYKGVVRDLKVRRNKDLQYAKGEYVAREIDKGEYKRKVRAIKERYQ
jgi:hypothetical protein